jgi:tetratricopeptide (TPR) repeat protein
MSDIQAIIAELEPERAYRTLTRIYAERDKLWEAFRYFSGLSERYDDLAAPLVAMGTIEMIRNHPERAAPIFENAVRREKYHQGALGGFARAKVRSGEAEAALGYFEKLLHSEPAAPGYRYGKAVALAEGEDYKAAATQFKWAIQLDRTSWLAERDYGRMLVPYGKHDLAVKHLERAIEILDAEGDPATAGELRVELVELQQKRGP